MKNIKCPRCGKNARVLTTLKQFKQKVFPKYMANCNNNTCLVEVFYWNEKP